MKPIITRSWRYIPTQSRGPHQGRAREQHQGTGAGTKEALVAVARFHAHDVLVGPVLINNAPQSEEETSMGVDQWNRDLRLHDDLSTAEGPARNTSRREEVQKSCILCGVCR